MGNIEKSVCLSTKVTREERELHKFACAAAQGESPGLWCKQQALREKLKETPASDIEARKQITNELQALTPPIKSGPGAKPSGNRQQIAKESAEATKRFCAQPTKSSYTICTRATVDDSYSYESLPNPLQLNSDGCFRIAQRAPNEFRWMLPNCTHT